MCCYYRHHLNYTLDRSLIDQPRNFLFVSGVRTRLSTVAAEVPLPIRRKVVVEEMDIRSALTMLLASSTADIVMSPQPEYLTFLFTKGYSLDPKTPSFPDICEAIIESALLKTFPVFALVISFWRSTIMKPSGIRCEPEIRVKTVCPGKT